MLQRILLSTIFMVVGVFSFACQTSPTATNNGAANAVSIENNLAVNVPVNVPVNNTANSAVNDGDAPFSLATPQEAVKTYYAALRKNDDKLFRRTLSKRAEGFLTKNFAEKGRLVDGVRRAMEYVKDSLEMPEVESETIDENRAVVKFKKGGQLTLVKEKNVEDLYHHR